MRLYASYIHDLYSLKKSPSIDEHLHTIKIKHVLKGLDKKTKLFLSIAPVINMETTIKGLHL